MSEFTHLSYNPLLQVHRSALRCGKCGLCRYIDNMDIQDIAYSAICPSGERFKFEEYYGSGKSELVRGLLTQLGTATNELEINDRLLHALYTCTLCGGCEKMCEALHKYPLKSIMALREYCVREEKAPLPPHQQMADAIAEQDNPFGNPPEARAAWAKGLRLKNFAKDKAEVLFFTGCMAASKGQHPVMQAAAKVLKAGGVNFGILGEAEPCCKLPLVRIGMRKSFEEGAKMVIAMIAELGVSKVVTTCAGCFQTLDREYDDLGERPFETVHISEMLVELLDDGALKLKKKVKGKVAYHDPCTLGRYTENYRNPREVLAQIPGLETVEFLRAKGNAWCCGAGCSGEVAALYPDYARETARIRLEEAKRVGAKQIVTACPFCEEHLRGAGGQVKDLVELVAEAL